MQTSFVNDQQNKNNMKMDLTTKRCFVTRDNASFADAREAKFHEAGLELTGRFTGNNKGVTVDFNLKAAMLYMANNYEKFADVFAAIRRANRH